MARKSDPKRSPEYSSLDEYRKAFFPLTPEGGETDPSDPRSFGVHLAREVLKKALEARGQPSQDGKTKNEVEPDRK